MQHIQHTVGIYRFFAVLAQAARRQSEHALCWWETGAMCERRYRVGEQWHNLRPDALAEYHVGSQQVCFWLEWDCGTMNARHLLIKFTSYTCDFVSRRCFHQYSRWHPPQMRSPIYQLVYEYMSYEYIKDITHFS